MIEKVKINIYLDTYSGSVQVNGILSPSVLHQRSETSSPSTSEVLVTGQINSINCSRI